MTISDAAGSEPDRTSSADGPASGSRLASRAGKIAWYANRLAAMDAGEIAHRLHEQAKRRSARWQKAGWPAFDTHDGPIRGLPIDAHILAGMRAGELHAALRDVRHRLVNEPPRLLGRPWPAASGGEKWHLDPCTGRSWPRNTYCFDIQHRGKSGLGDVKYVWEFNRLQHLQPLAMLAALEGDATLAAHCLAEIESWIDANPPFLGINWSSGIELALRAVSMLVVLGLVGEHVSEPLRGKLRACLRAHGHWLARFPSLHSSANNHLIAEAGGLFLIGSLMRDLPEAGEWERAGRDLLVREVERQIHLDGVGAEQSPTYTAFTLEWYLACLPVARERGAPFPQGVHRRLELAAEHLKWMTDDAGNQPRIGDDDEGRVLITSTEREPHYVSSVLACLSAALGRADLAPPILARELRGAVLGEPSGPAAPLCGVRDFPAGGYFVAARGMGGRKVHLVMDHGPLGHLSIAAHGHADALAVWLGIDGEPVLVDAGTYHYHAGGAWRDHFRSTPAHNTLSIEGASSSRMVGPFNWRRKAVTRLIDVSDTADGVAVRAMTDGFVHDFGLTHERCVTMGAETITILDRLEGTARAALDVEVGFLVNPAFDVRLEAAQGRFVIARSGRDVLEIAGGPDVVLALQRGEAEPPRGWYSPRFGEKMPAWRAVVKASIPNSRSGAAGGWLHATRLRVLA